MLDECREVYASRQRQRLGQDAQGLPVPGEAPVVAPAMTKPASAKEAALYAAVAALQKAHLLDQRA